MKARTWLEGAGAGILLTIGLTWNQLSSYHLDLYHRQLPIDTVVRAIAIDVVLVSLLGAAIVWLLDFLDSDRFDSDRFDSRVRTLLWTLFAAILAARAISGLIAAEVITRQGITPARVFWIVAALGVILWVLRKRWYSFAVRGFRTLLLLLGFSIFWIVPQLIHLGFAHQPQDRLSFAHPVPPTSAPHARVVWLLFDELSYDQLFDHRQSDLAMPNFDRLRAQSVTFSNVQPDGFFTEEVLPSLLLGQPVTAIRSSVAGSLFVRSAARGPWQSFNGDATLFADAQRAHWTTGLVGSYNPYCRLLANQLDACWTQLRFFDDHLSGQKSTLENVLAPVNATWRRTFHLPVEHTPTNAEKFQAMMDAAQGMIRNEDLDFVFVHLPLPHPPGTYDRRTGRIVAGGSYIDNMALSDRTLGVLQSTLAQTTSASMTTLIISSDHSWRVPLWRNAIGWTREDEAASQGRFDPRPVLMVRFPDQRQPQTIAQPFPALKEHDLIVALFRNSLTAANLDAWLAARN